MTRFALLFFTLLFSLHSLAQKEPNVWYFGAEAGIDFNGGTPVALTDGVMTTQEGCASIADRNTGQILFYTDGITVWDASHNTMLNGTGLLGDVSSTQSGVIVPKPGDPDLYYIFTVDNSAGLDGLRYSEVDMTLNGGLGGITANKNVFITGTVTEKITAVPHANNTDVWVITHDWNNDAFLAYQVSNAGVNLTPVTSNVGTIHTGITNNTIGYLKASHDCSKLALASSWDGDFVEVFDFDNATAAVSNPLTINIIDPYGLEFSPDDSRLYVTTNTDLQPQFLYQYDLQAGSPAAIIASETLLSTETGFGAIQLGPDGRLYIARPVTQFLGVVNNPNALGAACNYVSSGFNLNGKFTRLGLPNFITFKPPVADFTMTDFCFGDSVYFTNNSTNYDTLFWNFGDPLSGAADSSSLENPAHLYTAPGTYTVTLIAANSAGADTAQQQVTIHPLPTVSLGPDQTVCAGGGGVVLNAGSGYSSYLWSTGATTQAVTVSAIGPYWVEVTDANGCLAVDTVYLVPGTLTISLGLDQVYCDTFTTVLDGGSIGAYLWSTGDTTQTIAVTQPGQYWVALDDGICQGGDTIDIVSGAFTVDLGTDQLYCDTFTTVLDAAVVGSTYAWSTGDTTQAIGVNQPGQYWVEVDNGLCVESDTINIVSGAFTVDLGPDEVYCDTVATVLDAGVAGTYTWSTGDTTQTIGINQFGQYWVEVDNGLCIQSDTIEITSGAFTIDLGPDQLHCDTFTTVLDAGVAGTYAWSTGGSNQTISTNQPGQYWVTVNNGFCTASDTIDIVSGAFTVDLGNDVTFCAIDSLVLDAGSGVGYTYAWSGGDTTQLLSIAQPGQYWVTVNNGLCTSTDTIQASAGSLTINLGPDEVYCDTFATVLDAGAGAYTYAWSTGSTAQTVSTAQPGEYWVTVSDGICLGTDTIVVMQENVVVDLGADTVSCDVLTLDALNPGANYLWSTGATTATITVNDSAVYWVEVTSLNGCVATDTIVAQVDMEAFNTSIPNIFTPNGDEVNDLLLLSLPEIELVEVLIFNRWGQLMFATKQPAVNWDGYTSSGEPVPEGTYYWIINYLDCQDEPQTVKGAVQLVR